MYKDINVYQLMFTDSKRSHCTYYLNFDHTESEQAWDNSNMEENAT